MVSSAQFLIAILSCSVVNGASEAFSQVLSKSSGKQVVRWMYLQSGEQKRVGIFFIVSRPQKCPFTIKVFITGLRNNKEIK